jgi:hypothetical protein
MPGSTPDETQSASSEPQDAIVAWNRAAQHWLAIFLPISYMVHSLGTRPSAVLAALALAACSRTASTVPEPPSPTLAASTAPNLGCVTDADTAFAVMGRDYAGYRDNAAARPAALAAGARRDARNATDEAACLAAIRRVLTFCPDHHLQVGDRNPRPAPSSPAVSS